ncbi:hypothetical protein Q8A67_024348 [Cirrhinus molitorella]|uniref:Uncharacterized protein n=1 Tax=Cirrhinus molitorella TaxID=172907 RepID=A0AA88T9D7_9TELE|nr:hypothetical protein Q8A67_024348 [Cirrhinus molitorella]
MHAAHNKALSYLPSLQPSDSCNAPQMLLTSGLTHVSFLAWLWSSSQEATRDRLPQSQESTAGEGEQARLI